MSVTGRALTRRIAVLLFAAALAPANTRARAAADTSLACRRAIAKESSKLVVAGAQALQRCENSKVTGALPLTTDCRAATSAARAEALAKLAVTLGRKCGGRNRVCGVDDGDDLPLAAIDWPSACPTIQGSSGAACDGPIASCRDVADCLGCVDGTAVELVRTLLYGALELPSTSRALKGCQRTIGKAGIKFLAVRSKVLRDCWNDVLEGKAAAPCGGSGKTAAAIAGAVRKMQAAICSDCGGADEKCGGPDDVLPATIGFPAECAAAGGCRGPVTDLTTLVQCVACAVAFEADCAAAAAVPGLAPYPVACAGPTPASSTTSTSTSTSSTSPSSTTSTTVSTSTTTTTTPPCGTPGRSLPTATPTVTATGAVAIVPAPHVAAVTVPPLVTATLHGAATDPDGPAAFTFRWRLLSVPAGNTAGLSGAPGAGPGDVTTQQNPTLFAQLSGDYVVEVVATDPTGCPSAPATVLVRVTPATALNMQLTWDQSVDMDLQLARGTTFSLTADGERCFWGSRVPAWDPVVATLDIDDLAACNPESISVNASSSAPATDFTIFAHVFCNHRAHLTAAGGVCSETHATSTTVATLKVYVNGVLATIDGTSTAAAFSRTLGNGGVWKVARLRFDTTGWHVFADDELLPERVQCTEPWGEATCVCGNPELDDLHDPYCGVTGAGCRQRFP